MEITIVNSVPEYARKHVRGAIEEALRFMRALRPDTNFENVNFIVGKGSRCRYFRNQNDYRQPCVYLNTDNKWLTYEMKSLGRTADDINCGYRDYYVTGAIHELTHHWQYENGKPTGELETTRNEIEWVRQNRPDVYEQMEEI